MKHPLCEWFLPNKLMPKTTDTCAIIWIKTSLLSIGCTWLARSTTAGDRNGSRVRRTKYHRIMPFLAKLLGRLIWALDKLRDLRSLYGQTSVQLFYENTLQTMHRLFGWGQWKTREPNILGTVQSNAKRKTTHPLRNMPTVARASMSSSSLPENCWNTTPNTITHYQNGPKSPNLVVVTTSDFSAVCMNLVIWWCASARTTLTRSLEVVQSHAILLFVWFEALPTAWVIVWCNLLTKYCPTKCIGIYSYDDFI